MNTKKWLAALGAATLAVALSGLTATTAGATDGQEYIPGGDFSAATVDGLLNVPGATTDFSLTTLYGQATSGGDGSMWDPGTYVVGSNPHDFHQYWVDLPTADPMMIVNGFTESESQKVLSVTVHPEACATNSTITYQFTANAMNIVDPGAGPGANLSVTINGTSIGSQNLTGVTPDTPVDFTGAVPWAANMEVIIWNSGTAYSGNDFAIDDISLIQRGSCEPPCEPTTMGVWFNYTGKFTGTGTPALNDPKWHALPATPGGEHALAKRGFNQPYNPGADKGKGDWFVWKDLGTTCPA